MTDEPTPDQPAEATQGDPADLGDAGKAALKAERARADAAEKALKVLQTEHEQATAKVTEFEKFQHDAAQQLAAKELAITRLNVGLEKGLPKELIARLQGADEAALQADADELLKFIPAANHAPRPDPSQGAKAPANTSPEAQFTSVMEGLFNH